MRYFKVTDGKMRSRYYYDLHGKGVQYNVGEFVRPERGELFCYSLNHLSLSGFDEYDSSRMFRPRMIKLFECECIDPRETTVVCMSLAFLKEEDVGFLWPIYGKNTIVRQAVLAKEIKLIKEVSDEELQSIIAEKYGKSL